MADADLTVNRVTIPDFYEQPRALTRLLETALNQVLETQMAEHLAVDRYERNEDREGYRNSYRDRQSASRYSRSEQAFVVGLMEMIINGVSTRKITRMTGRDRRSQKVDQLLISV